jgi:hypothetical protein
MDPNKWGPHLWFFLHTISFNYPENPSFKNKVDYNDHYNSLKNILPCELCRVHYIQYLEQHPPDLSSRNALVKWTIDLHNKVNNQIGKPIYSYEKAITLYKNYFKGITNELTEHNYSTPIEDSNDNFIKYLQIGSLTLLLVLLLLYLLMTRNVRKVRFI